MKFSLITVVFLAVFSIAVKAQTKPERADTIHVDNLVMDEGGIEVLPFFPGGQQQFYKYLGKNIHYPPSAVKNHVQGKVHLSFIIEKDGSIDSIKIIKGVSTELNEEAVRVIKNSPKWIPATRGGKPISIRYSLPINFVLPKTNK